MRTRILIAFITLLLPVATTIPGIAAEVSAAKSEACVISIGGELVAGDYDRFRALAAVLFPEEVGEASSENTVCLDSPGGHLAEGVKFARHFYKEGVGTVIESGAECHSACAIMFMMGTAQGAEVAYANRRLHVDGVLGFHRPYLNLPQGEQVDISMLAVAADAAYQSTLDLISVANSKVPWTSEPMMKSDLMQAMLQHVGNDMFLIDTVDKAARFGIEIVGAGPPPALTEASAYYACLNTLQWQHGLTDAPITYTPKMSEPTAEYLQAVRLLPTGTVDKAYRINGPKDGYARHGCVVAEIEGRVQICGADEYTNVVAGGGSCEDTDYAGKLEMVQALTLYDPMTPLRSLGARKVAMAPSNEAVRIFRCVVRNKVAIEDDELCKFVGGRSSEGWDTANFIWPSGSKTVLVMNPAGMEINGVHTVAVDRDGLGLCYPNSRTGREFCVSAAE
ncbi:hypothetical protein IGS74_18090 [Aureimonas sp. OT7]|uniref:hypothetical protein n=1 Tax=Aureimonas sp. OT7 TaxID=2816454 RepID=UPI0017813C8C|nr:hypothetical protein [Aureimonas sp. OT7]QOG06413.1 hypothetical protein IGS74_18090 [Aureimonas sp. OT7]